MTYEIVEWEKISKKTWNLIVNQRPKHIYLFIFTFRLTKWNFFVKGFPKVQIFNIKLKLVK